MAVAETLTECPVSFITSRSAQIVSMFHNAGLIREQTGGSALGDPSEWPGWLVDAALIVKVAEIRQENARIEVEQSCG